jgi:hypothetical protein
MQVTLGKWTVRRKPGGYIHDRTSPEVTLSKGQEVETSDDSEVVRTTLESVPQIAVLLAIRVDDGSVCDDNLRRSYYSYNWG